MAGFHVLVDAVSACSAGARTWMSAMVGRLAALDDTHVSVACREDQRAGFGWSRSLPPRVAVLPVPSWVRPLGARLAFSASVIPWLAARKRVDVLVCPSDHAPPWAPCAVTLMVRNPTPYARGVRTGISRGRRAREAAMRAVTAASAWQSERVIVVSQSSLDAIQEAIPLPVGRVRVVHHGVDGVFSPPPVGQLRDENLLLAVGSLYAFKGHSVLLEALARLASHHGRRPQLLVAGAPLDARHAAWLRKRARALGVESQVRWLGEVPSDEVIGLYRRAGLFVMPSQLETFGHPYVEAMATGTPALVGDIPCAREICGDAVAYAEATSSGDLARKLDALLGDAAARDRLARAGPLRAARFSWDRCATETMLVLREACAARRPGLLSHVPLNR